MSVLVLRFLQQVTNISYDCNDKDENPTYPALLANQFPIVVVGAVGVSGFYEHYSQGFAPDLTVSAPGPVRCANRGGGTAQVRGTSVGEPVNAKINK